CRRPAGSCLPCRAHPPRRCRPEFANVNRLPPNRARSCFNVYAQARVTIELDRGPMNRKEMREATGGRGGGGNAASRIVGPTSQWMDVLVWDFLSAKILCRLARGPIPA